MIKNELSLKLRQSGQLILTTRLQQAIQLLQFSSEELNEFVLNQVMKNPLLEFSEDSSLQMSEKEPDNQYNDYSPSQNATPHDTSQPHEKPLWNHPLSFHQYIIHQIHQSFENAQHKEIAFYFFHNLDEDGFLNSHWSNAYAIFKHHEQDIDFVLNKLKSLEPIGVFAENLYDSFKIQLKVYYHENNKEYDEILISSYLEGFRLLQTTNMQSVIKKMNFNENEFIKFLKILKNLEFHPARNFENQYSDIQTRCPDIIISKTPYNELEVHLNPQSLPKVVVNSAYFNELKKKFKVTDDVDYLKEQMSSANWLLQSLQKRALTMLKVAQTIAEIQKQFFCHAGSLAPMTLKDVAQMTAMHESTISRISTSKTLDTPRGIMNLKSLFTNTVGHNEQANSSIEIQNAIKDIVSDEPKNRPLSDEDLVDLLNTKGFVVARRTVSKYRTILGIASSSQRKKIYKAHASCITFH